MLTRSEVQSFVNNLVFYIKDQMTREEILECVGTDRGKFTYIRGHRDLVRAGQIDALVDIVYYIFNTLVKVDDCGFYQDPIFRDMWIDVVTFTRESAHKTFEPVIFDKERLQFIVKMVLSEVEELCDTVAFTAEDSRSMIISALDHPGPPIHLFHRMGFLYFIVHLCYQKSLDIDGVKFEEVFALVQEANMAKRNPETGQFMHREDGKILKPPGWTAPDILTYVQSRE